MKNLKVDKLIYNSIQNNKSFQTNLASQVQWKLQNGIESE